MRIVKNFTNRFVRWQYKKTTKYLSESSPDLLVSDGEKKLLKIFKKNSNRIPFYKDFLASHHIEPKKILSIEDFQRNVPLLDKETVFSNNPLSKICVNGRLDDICLVYSSSGSSGTSFSFGLETWNNISKIALGLEYMFDNSFDIFNQKTFVINCLPMGVKVYTRTLPVAETSVREDVVIALLKKLKLEFDQFIIIGESPFLKKVFEDAIQSGISFQDIKINVITGGEYIAETYRSYLAELLSIDLDNPETGSIAVNMGLSELSLSIFSECHETIQIRRAATKNPKFRQSLFGESFTTPPVFMQYFPQQTWLETIADEEGNNRLVVSLLNPDLKIPMIRYNTEDIVTLIPYKKVSETLDQFSLSHLKPKFKLPFGIITGKKMQFKDNTNKILSVCDIKEALYENYALAEVVTGNFKFAINSEGNFTVQLQLKKNESASQELKDAFLNVIKRFTDAEIIIKFRPYYDFGFGIEHNFEKKNRYI